MGKVLLILLALSCWVGFSAVSNASNASSHSYSQSHTSKPPKPKKSKISDPKKTVHVQGYHRKDGTYVAPYDRRPPGSVHSTASSGKNTYHRNYVADGYTAHPTVQRDKHGKIKRSKSARNTFIR